MFEIDTQSSAIDYFKSIESSYACLSGPLTIMWDMTNRCNLSCKHCYNKSSSEGNYEDLSDEWMYAVAQQIIEMNPFVTCFCGGEPVLRKDTIFPIAQMLNEHSICVNMVSNATLITKEVAQEIYEAKFSSIQVSVDGVKPETHDYFRGVKGAYDKTIRGIQNLIDQKFDVAVTFIPTKLNYKEFPKLCDKMYSLGVRQIRTMPFIPIGRGKDNSENLKLSNKELYEFGWSMRKIREKYKDITIDWGDPLEHIKLFPNNRSGRTVLVEIRSNGDIIPSSYLPFVVGNVKRATLRQYWNAGLCEVWNNSCIQKWTSKLLSLSDLETQSNAPWSHDDYVIDLI